MSDIQWHQKQVKESVSKDDTLCGVNSSNNYAVRYRPFAITGTVNPKHYGSIGDGVADDTVAIQAAIDAIPLTGGCVFFPAGNYKVSTINLKKCTSGFLYIVGYGAKIISTTNAKILQRVPTDQSEAQNTLTGSGVIIEGLSIEGNGGNAQDGIYIGGSYGSVIKNCKFLNLNNGINLRFALMSSVENCTIQNCNNDGLIIGSGSEEWSGGNASNSQSNGTKVDQLRVFCKLGQRSCVFVETASDCRLNGLIFEGANPQHGLYILVQSTVVKGLSVDTIHNECIESVAFIYLNLNNQGGIYVFKNVFSQYEIINVLPENGNTAIIHFENLLYFIGTFKKDLCKWVFF